MISISTYSRAIARLWEQHPDLLIPVIKSSCLHRCHVWGSSGSTAFCLRFYERIIDSLPEEHGDRSLFMKDLRRKSHTSAIYITAIQTDREVWESACSSTMIARWFCQDSWISVLPTSILHAVTVHLLRIASIGERKRRVFRAASRASIVHGVASRRLTKLIDRIAPGARRICKMGGYPRCGWTIAIRAGGITRDFCPCGIGSSEDFAPRYFASGRPLNNVLSVIPK